MKNLTVLDLYCGENRTNIGLKVCYGNGNLYKFREKIEPI